MLSVRQVLMLSLFLLVSQFVCKFLFEQTNSTAVTLKILLSVSSLQTLKEYKNIMYTSTD